MDNRDKFDTLRSLFASLENATKAAKNAGLRWQNATMQLNTLIKQGIVSDSDIRNAFNAMNRAHRNNDIINQAASTAGNAAREIHNLL